MSSNLACTNYFLEKKKRIRGLEFDLSRKGVVDEPIQCLITFINNLDDYVTTSSCSGRIIIISKNEEGSSKKGCKWVTTNHSIVDPQEILLKITNCHEKNMVLKFEPFILHVLCRNLNSAKQMQNCALAAGFRNSGSIIGRNGSLTTAVRGTHGLEVPLSNEHGLMVTNEYIKFILDEANIKMQENERKREIFSRAVYGMKTNKLEQKQSS